VKLRVPQVTFFEVNAKKCARLEFDEPEVAVIKFRSVYDLWKLRSVEATAIKLHAVDFGGRKIAASEVYVGNMTAIVFQRPKSFTKFF
jgi:hypothetical protein